MEEPEAWRLSGEGGKDKSMKRQREGREVMKEERWKQRQRHRKERRQGRERRKIGERRASYTDRNQRLDK